MSAAAWTFEEVRPVPPPHAASIPHTPSTAPHRGAELNHTRPTSAHALVGAGECSVALYGVARRRCRVSLLPPSAVLGGRGARSPRRHRGLSAARLPLLAAQTALPTQAAGWAAVGSSGYCRRASWGRSERLATPLHLERHERVDWFGYVPTSCCASLVGFEHMVRSRVCV